MPQDQQPIGWDETGKPVYNEQEHAAAVVAKHQEDGTPVPHPTIQWLLSFLPAAGGIAGGVMGGAMGAPAGGVGAVPGAVGGAALGGATGASVAGAINHAIGNTPNLTNAGAASDVVTQGAIQGGGELAGAGLVSLAGPLSAALMRGAMKPGVKALGKSIETGEVPAMVRSALESGSSVTKSGVKTAVKAREVASAAKDEIVANLPGRVSPTQVAQQATDYVSKLAVPSDRKSAQKVLNEFVDTYVRDPATGRLRPFIDPVTADAAKTDYRAGISYGKMGKPVIETRKLIAKGFKDGLENLDPSKGNLKAANEAYGAAAGAASAISKAHALWQNKPLAMRALKALTLHSPAISSLLAHGLYDQAAKLAQVPRLTIDILGSQLAQSATEGQ